jgi:Tfp pilus assembly protein PilX
MRTRGMALPVVLIILAVMLLGSIYLLKSVRSTELSTANLSYDTTLSRAADYGLHQAYQWLSTQAATSKAALDNPIASATFYSPQSPAQSPTFGGFWANAKSVAGDDGTTVDYVINRLCLTSGAYNVGGNACIKTATNNANGVVTGTSQKPGPVYATVPQVHYLITSRIRGPRGANVINQMVVLI